MSITKIETKSEISHANHLLHLILTLSLKQLFLPLQDTFLIIKICSTVYIYSPCVRELEQMPAVSTLTL